MRTNLGNRRNIKRRSKARLMPHNCNCSIQKVEVGYWSIEVKLGCRVRLCLKNKGRRSFCHSAFSEVVCVQMKLHVSFPADGCRRLTEVGNDCKLPTSHEEHMATEVKSGRVMCWESESVVGMIRVFHKARHPDPWKSVPAVEYRAVLLQTKGNRREEMQVC